MTIVAKTQHQLLQEDKVFRLDISHDANHLVANGSSNSDAASYSETLMHRKIIGLFKHRDDFEQMDLNVCTSRGLSGRTRVDVSNALMHMRSKGKKLRRLTADIDYMEPSVHEFVLMACLWFDEICITSNPEFEQTSLSVGLAMAVRHALTCNQKCARVLELTCGVSEETSDVLADAMANAHQLEVLQCHLLAGRSSHLCGVLDGLQGKSNLKQLHLRNVNADAAESLASLLGNSRCRITELELRYDWERTPHYNTAKFCDALADISNESVTRLILDGIRFFSTAGRDKDADSTTTPSASLPTRFFATAVRDDDDADSTTNQSASSLPSTRVLATAFSHMETLSLSAPEMPSFVDFLDLPPHQLPPTLKSCYFPNCTVSDVEQARNLVERLPALVDIPDYESDPIVQHFLDWRLVMKQQQEPTCATVWPFILERTTQKLGDHPGRQANMLYTLLQDYHGLQKSGKLVFPVKKEEEQQEDTDSDENDDNFVAVDDEDVFAAIDEGDADGDY